MTWNINIVTIVLADIMHVILPEGRQILENNKNYIVEEK